MTIAADYEWVVGLEVHCQLKTRTKMFTSCAYEPGLAPNRAIDPYSLGLPGTLPVPNRRAVEMAVRLALALGCDVQTTSRWARKHYFYPDLPKGYQITQHDEPYAVGGVVPVELDGQTLHVRLHHVHMEEDAGKASHRGIKSLVDYNRAGVPLVEIVSEPDLRSARAAAEYLRTVRSLVRGLGISDGNMEEGTLRCDANVSVRPMGSTGFGTRCEIKNLNSFKFLERAIEVEAARQIDVVRSGGKVQQCTLGYDSEAERTYVTRIKEDAADYRYFPEPDLPRLCIAADWIEAIRAGMPELPWDQRRRYRTLGLGSDEIELLVTEPAMSNYFDHAVALGRVPVRKLSNWMLGELLSQLRHKGLRISDCPVGPLWLVQLVELVERDAISGRVAKEVLQRGFEEDVEPVEIVRREGYAQVSDESELRAVLTDLVALHREQFDALRGGKTKLRGFFVGLVMKATRGRASPKAVNALLDSLLASRE